jgi:hypothetical protein
MARRPQITPDLLRRGRGLYADTATVSAGPNDSYEIAGGSGYQLAGSGSAAGTFLWTQVSGPGTATFVDATDPETLVDFDAPGTYVLLLAMSYGGYTRISPLTLTVTVDLSAMGASLIHHYEPSLVTVTGGSTISSLSDLVLTGSVAMAQATSGNRPAFTAAGGPNDYGFVDFQDVNRALVGSISLAAGHRTALYVVAKASATNSRTLTNSDLGIYNLFRGTDTFCANTIFNGGGAEFLVITVPAVDTDWHLFAYVPLATGALFQIDGVTTTPDFVSAAGLDALTTFRLGHIGSAGGSIASAFMVSGATGALNTIAKRYVAAKFGLTVA